MVRFSMILHANLIARTSHLSGELPPDMEEMPEEVLEVARMDADMLVQLLSQLYTYLQVQPKGGEQN